MNQPLRERTRRIDLSIVRSVLAILTLSAMLCRATLVLAGTTGQLVGSAVDAVTNAPLAGATITVASPSQVAKTTTDSGGRFTFLSLAPDSYLVTIELNGYESAEIAGVNVIADNSRTLNLPIHKALKVIGIVKPRYSSSLVKPGTTSDVYSIDATQQAKLSVAGGGGTQNTAYSALSTVPGVYVQPGQSGYVGNEYLSIRGGGVNEIGNEIDGVPVNRAFDESPSGPASSLGQQELQVYTGGGPASSEAQGLSGFINQVIRTGTYPGFANVDVGIGGPSYYHKASFEFGGATKDRNFSYYIGIGGYNQTFRVADQFNGQGIGELYGTPIAPCAPVSAAVEPSCYAKNASGQMYGYGVNAYNSFLGGPVNSYLLGGPNLFTNSQFVDRDNTINLHFGIPHKNGTKDDIQILGMVNFLRTYYYDSTNDLGGAAFLQTVGYTSGLGVPYADSLQLNSKTGVFLPANYQSLVSNYLFPSSPQGRAPGSIVPSDQEDNSENEQGILKVQYTHPFSPSALVKLYGYTYYSDLLQTGPQSALAYFFAPSGPDYQLSSHTRGLSGMLIDQINAQNLLQLQGSYTTSKSLRDNSFEIYDGSGSKSIIAYVVDSSHPTNGLCYAPTGGPALSCADAAYSATNPTGVGQATLGQAQSGSITPATGTCGTGACRYLVTDNGQYATYNQVTPKFTALSLTDDFHPTSKLVINGGIRLDVYQYQGADTTGTAARTFFYNAYNADNCLDPQNTLVPIEPGAGCPAGDRPAAFVNPAGKVTESYTAFEPRLGATYSLDPTTVLRANYGRYTEAPNSAYEQYDTLQQNAPATLYGNYGFQKFGFFSPNHTVRPPAANSYDFSFEKSLPNQISLKISPFYRRTQDQIQSFLINPQTGFGSGLNVGRETARGVEFELDKGNFANDGLSAKVSFTYTNSYINYNATASGTTVLSEINSDIATYNSYTSACAPGGKLTGKTQYGQALCGASTTGAAQACYTSTLDTNCVANPYYNAPAQPLLDPNANYPTYYLFPGSVGSSVNGYNVPYQGSLILNYKKGPFAITPVLQISGGERYGAPESTYGIVPGTCGELAGATSTTGDPRFPYGSSAGLPYDALSCTTGLAIPDPYTKAFDGVGAFVAPAIAQLHLQLTYDVSKNLTLTANASNLFTTCFGSTKEPFNVPGACGYSLLANGSTGDVGNQYNPGAAIQPYINTPYEPTFAPNPFSVYVTARFKI